MIARFLHSFNTILTHTAYAENAYSEHFYLKCKRVADYTLHRATVYGASMIRALVFITTLGFMISFGVLTCNHSSTRGDVPANHPPSIKEQHDRTYSLLPLPEEETVVELSVE